jgi:hypothetical protein
MAGFHLNFAFLGEFLAEDWADERVAEESRRRVEAANRGVTEDHPPASQAEWSRLVDVYYDHIVAACPKG